MKFLRNSRSDLRRAADIRADRDKVGLAALGAKASAIEQKRRELLLTGTDAELEENGRELAAARLQVERAETLIEELTRLASEAEAREAAEALEEDYADVMKAKAALDKAIADAETVAAQLKAHFDEATAAAAIVARWNRRVDPAAQPDRRIVHTTPETAKQRMWAMFR